MVGAVTLMNLRQAIIYFGSPVGLPGRSQARVPNALPSANLAGLPPAELMTRRGVCMPEPTSGASIIDVDLDRGASRVAAILTPLIGGMVFVVQPGFVEA